MGLCGACRDPVGDDGDQDREGAGQADDGEDDGDRHRDVRRRRRARLRVERGRAQRDADDRPDREEAVAGNLRLQQHQDQPQDDEEKPCHVEGQAPEADEGEEQGDRADDPGHEVRVLELEDQPVEADREQDEGDVGVREQVEERLERVHRDLHGDRVRGRQRDLPATRQRHRAAVGRREDLLDGRRDPVDCAGGDRLRRGVALGLLHRGDRPVDRASARLRRSR